MFVEERHQEILHLLEVNDKVKVKDLSKRFEVTEDCIRKDLASMESRNLLKRTYGGAVRYDALHPGHSNIVSSRKDKNREEKIKIAKKAVQLIHPGNMIFLDTSTTNIELARNSTKRIRSNCSKLYVGYCSTFFENEKVKFILLGGEFNRSQNGFLGELTIQMMKNFRFDCAFLGVVGADIDRNEIMTYVPEDGIMKHNVINKSRKCYLMMEKCKFEFKANYVYTTFDNVNGIICEENPSIEIMDKLKEYQVEVVE